MPNLSSLTPLTTAATALSNLILVSPQSTIGYQPQNADGSTSQQPPAFLFHYEGEQTVSLESDITDHYVEDNTALQDQIALRPETVTTHGFIGELNDIAPYGLQTIQSIADKLTPIGAYTPVLSVTALIAYNEALQLYQTAANALNSAVSAWGSLTGSGGESVIGANGLQSIQSNQNKQQVAFQQFYGYWRQRQLFTVQTPWAVFQGMAIKSLRAIQDDKTNTVTDFELSFKIIRTASTQTSSGLASLQQRAATQAASLTSLGSSNGVQSITLTSGIQSSYPGSFSSLS